MTQLVVYERARAALIEAKTLNEVRQIVDKSEAIRAYAIMAKDRDLELHAAELRIRAERRLGQMINEMKASPKIKVAGKSNPKVDIDPERIGFSKRLKELAIGENLRSRARKFSSIDDNRFEQLLSGWRSRALHETNVGLPPELREGRRAVKRPHSYMLGGGDVRLWSLAKVRRTVAILQAIAEHCGGASGDESCGDLISNDKLRDLMADGNVAPTTRSKLNRREYAQRYYKASTRGGRGEVPS